MRYEFTYGHGLQAWASDENNDILTWGIQSGDAVLIFGHQILRLAERVKENERLMGELARELRIDTATLQREGFELGPFVLGAIQKSENDGQRLDDEVNRLGRENCSLKAQNAALEEENRMYRAQCAAQQQVLLRFYRWSEEGLPAHPERQEAYFEAKDLLAHPTGQLAVEWFRAEKAELQAERNALVDRLLSVLCIGADDAEKDPRSIVDLLVEHVERQRLRLDAAKENTRFVANSWKAEVNRLETDLAAAVRTGEGQAEEIGRLKERNACAQRGLLRAHGRVYELLAEAGEVDDHTKPAACWLRLARLDALLGSEEPVEDFRRYVYEQSGGYVELAWRWFRETLASGVTGPGSEGAPPTADEVYGILHPSHPIHGGPGFDAEGKPLLRTDDPVPEKEPDPEAGQAACEPHPTPTLPPLLVSEEEAPSWKHFCHGIPQPDLELWIPRCPHCGRWAPAEFKFYGTDWKAEGERLARENEELRAAIKIHKANAREWNEFAALLSDDLRRVSAAVSSRKPALAEVSPGPSPVEGAGEEIKG